MPPNHYTKAPITEAVIDLRVASSSDRTAIDLALGFAAIHERYPMRQEIPAAAQFEIHLVPGAAPSMVGGGPVLGGFRFISADRQKILQARLDGFTFSWLPPYDRWDAFRAEAQELWQLYHQAFQPQQVTRAAVRYINRFDLPAGRIELRDYLRTFPQVSEEMPFFDLAGFLTQLHIPQPDLDAMLVVNQGLVPPPEPGLLSLLLDLDLFRAGLTWDAADHTAVWEFMEKLHVRKNEVFEASITDQMREVIR